MSKHYANTRTYGKALYRQAEEDNQVATVYQELMTLREIFKEVPDLGNLLTDDRLNVYEKVNIVKDLENQFSDLVAKFIHMIYDYGRMDGLPQMIDEFEHVYYEKMGMIVVTATTAIPLTQKQRHQLENQAAIFFKAQKAILHTKIDPSIMGGMIIESESRIIDQSVRKRLENMHQTLLK